MPTDHVYKKKSSKNKFWNFLIWNKLNQTLVREIDATWNPVQISISLMYRKLISISEFREFYKAKAFLKRSGTSTPASRNITSNCP